MEMNHAGPVSGHIMEGLGDPMRNFYLDKEADCYAEIRREIDRIVGLVSPVHVAESRRQSVCAFVKQLVETVVKNPVAVVGSFASKMYLPDSDIDLTAFVEPDQGTNWVTDLVAVLVRRGLDDDNRDDVAHQVRNVTFVNAETKLVKCVVNNIQVDITDNKVNNIVAANFVLALDKAVGKNNLLSRSILLIKAWCAYDAVGFVQEPLLGSDKSRLTSYGLTTMVLYIFNRFEIGHPLEALAHFFTYFKSFHWKKRVLTIFGPIEAINSEGGTSSTKHTPTAATGFTATRGDGSSVGGSSGSHISFANAAASCKFSPLLPMKVLKRFHKMMQECRSASTVKVSASNDSAPRFQTRHVNILDPIDDSNNIGRSVNKPGVLEMAHAFASGEKYLKTVFGCLSYAAHFDAATAPWEDGQSPVLQARAFFQQLFHSSLNKFGRGDGFRPDLLTHPCETWVWRPATSSGSKSHSRTQASTATGYAAAVISGGGGSNGAGARTSQHPGDYALYLPSNVDVKAARFELDESRRVYSQICSAMGNPRKKSSAGTNGEASERARKEKSTAESTTASQGDGMRKSAAGKIDSRVREARGRKNSTGRSKKGSDASGDSSKSTMPAESPSLTSSTSTASNEKSSRSDGVEGIDDEERIALLAAAHRIRSPKEIQRLSEQPLDHLHGTSSVQSVPSPKDPHSIPVDAVLSRLNNLPSPLALAAESVRGNIFKTPPKPKDSARRHGANESKRPDELSAAQSQGGAGNVSDSSSSSGDAESSSVAPVLNMARNAKLGKKRQRKKAGNGDHVNTKNRSRSNSTSAARSSGSSAPRPSKVVQEKRSLKSDSSASRTKDGGQSTRRRDSNSSSSTSSKRKKDKKARLSGSGKRAAASSCSIKDQTSPIRWWHVVWGLIGGAQCTGRKYAVVALWLVGGVLAATTLFALWPISSGTLAPHRVSSMDSAPCSGHGETLWLAHKQWILADNTLAASEAEKQKSSRTTAKQNGKKAKQKRTILPAKDYPTADADNIHAEVLEFVDLHDPTDPRHLAATGRPAVQFCACHRGWMGPACEHPFVGIRSAHLTTSDVGGQAGANATDISPSVARADRRRNALQGNEGSGCGSGGVLCNSLDATAPDLGDIVDHNADDDPFWIQADFSQHRQRSSAPGLGNQYHQQYRHHQDSRAFSQEERAMNPHLLHHHVPPAHVTKLSGGMNSQHGVPGGGMFGGGSTSAGSGSRRSGQMGRGANNGGVGGGYASNSFAGDLGLHLGMPEGAVTE